MADDRSLDEFLDGDTESEESVEQAESDRDASEDAGTAQAVDPAAVDPATTTYSWEPAGGACTVCGEDVDRRWESADGLVCQACKEW